jgi:hypothetical protein
MEQDKSTEIQLIPLSEITEIRDILSDHFVYEDFIVISAPQFID